MNVVLFPKDSNFSAVAPPPSLSTDHPVVFEEWRTENMVLDEV
jgi:hypothetical protein